jgi:hypothetical protein
MDASFNGRLAQRLFNGFRCEKICFANVLYVLYYRFIMLPA